MTIHKEPPVPSSGAFTKDVISTFVTQVIVFFGAAITSIIIARTLGPHGKGLIAIALLAPQLLALAGGLGINISNTYYAGKPNYSDRQMVANSLLISLAIGGLLTAAFILFVPVFSELFLEGAPYRYLYFTVPLVTFLLIQENLSYLLLGHRKISQFNVVKIFRTFSYLLLLLVFLYLMEMEIMGVIWAHVIAVVSTVVIVFYYMVKNGYGVSIQYHAEVFWGTLKFGLKGHLGTMFQFLNYRLDLLIVAYFLPLASVGLYEVAVLLAEIIWYIPNSISQILLSKTASSKKAEADHFTPIVFRHTFYLTALAAGVLFIISEPLVHFLFTAEFSPSILALRFLLPGIIALSIWKILINDLTGRGFPQYRTYSSAMAVCVTVVLDIMLIPLWGIMGAAIATSIAYGVASVASVFWFIKISGVEIRRLFFLEMDDMRYYTQMIRSLQLGK